MTSKSIFVTGADSGIGETTARLFAENGWRVGLADRQEEAARTLADDIGGQAQPFCVDVSNPGHFAIGSKVDATPWDARRNIMKSLTGY